MRRNQQEIEKNSEVGGYKISGTRGKCGVLKVKRTEQLQMTI
jgi:hypothetical protein